MGRKSRLVLFLGIILVLAACSITPIAPHQQPVTLRFVYRSRSVEIEPLLEEFHAHYPYITVEPVQLRGWGSDIPYQRLAQEQVDILFGGPEILALAENGLIRPLDSLQIADWASIRDDYYQGTWEALSKDGRQWGIPAGLDIISLYVNTSAVRSLGLSLPDTTQGWDALGFLQFAMALNFPDGLPYGEGERLFGFCTDPSQWDPLLFIYLWNGKIVDNLTAPQRPTLDEPETIEALRWYTQLFTRYGVAPDPEVIQQSYQGGIFRAQAAGHCGLWLGLYSARGGLNTPGRWPFEWDMLPLPNFGGNHAIAQVQGYYITTSSAHPKEALLLARFLSNQWRAAGIYVPPRKSLVKDPAYEQEVGARVAAMARTMPDRIMALPTSVSPKLTTVSAAVLRAVEQSIKEGLDMEPLLLQAQDQLLATF